MKNILICPDIHFCQNWSIIRERGKRYSARLENCIKSINWVMNTALQNNCSSIFYLGDFFNRSDLNAEEITALSSLDFDIGINQFSIVGNHEIKTKDNFFNSSNCLQKFIIFNKYQLLEDDKTAIHLLPYLCDCVSDIGDIIKKVPNKKNLILSHNDLKGINYGNYISENGFDLESINKNCDLFINGHIHNSSWINEKILNLGILTGQNFNEDCSKYDHHIAILDLDTFNIKLIENPYAFNFIEIKNINNSKDLIASIENLNKNNLVIYVKVPIEIQIEAKNILENYKSKQKVFTYKIVIERKYNSLPDDKKEDVKFLKNNPLQDLRKCILEYVDNSDLTKSELDIICS